MTETQYQRSSDDSSPLRPEERAAIRVILKSEEWKRESGRRWADRWKRMAAILAGTTAVVGTITSLWGLAKLVGLA